MQKYWAENSRVQKWGLTIFKSIILGSLAISVCYIGVVSLIDFIKLSNNHLVADSFCAGECSPFWIIFLFLLLSVSIVGVVVSVWKAPKGFWLNFLLVLCGILGVIYMEDAWAFSWQPGSYYSAYPDHVPTYMGYITRNLLYWIWCVIGVGQIYLPKRPRNYIMWTYVSISAIMVVGGLIINMHSY